MKFIQERERKTEVTYSLEFRWKDDLNAGFGFPCNKQGVPEPLNDVAADNLRKCQDGTYDVVPLGIVRSEHSYYTDRIGICDRCGRKVYLTGFTNTCECGTDYNMSGQMLAPRECWGEETGEHWSDIVNSSKEGW